MTTERSWQVGPDQAGVRLDHFLAARLSLSRAQAARLVGAGRARINGRKASKGASLGEADRVSVRLEPGDDLGPTAAARPDSGVAVEVVYEDAHLVIANKPGGMACHPLKPGELGTLASGLLARYPEMASVGHSPREPGLVHRLDTDTSGLVMAARSRVGFDALVAALRAGSVDKRYKALVAGHPHAPATHRAFLDARGPTVRVWTEPGAGRRAITTEVMSVDACGDHSLAGLRVASAGRHQVRAHMAQLGHPLYGDPRYRGPRAHDGGGHLLHACALAFLHPISGEQVSAGVDPPARFQACMAHLARCGRG